MRVEVLDLLSCLQRLTNAKAVAKLVGNYRRLVSNETDLHTAIIKFNNLEVAPATYIYLDYPPELTNILVKCGALWAHPLVASARKTCVVYSLKEIEAKKESFRKLAENLLRYGIIDILAVPTHIGDGSVIVTFFAINEMGCSKKNEVFLTAISRCFSENYAKLTRRTETLGSRLTRREVECLEWIANGKTSWETGIILNISERTVNFHINNAVRKLDCCSRTMGIVKAICSGEITPQPASSGSYRLPN